MFLPFLGLWLITLWRVYVSVLGMGAQTTDCYTRMGQIIWDLARVGLVDEFANSVNLSFGFILVNIQGLRVIKTHFYSCSLLALLHYKFEFLQNWLVTAGSTVSQLVSYLKLSLLRLELLRRNLTEFVRPAWFHKWPLLLHSPWYPGINPSTHFSPLTLLFSSLAPTCDRTDPPRVL